MSEAHSWISNDLKDILKSFVIAVNSKLIFHLPRKQKKNCSSSSQNRKKPSHLSFIPSIISPLLQALPNLRHFPKNPPPSHKIPPPYTILASPSIYLGRHDAELEKLVSLYRFIVTSSSERSAMIWDEQIILPLSCRVSVSESKVTKRSDLITIRKS